MSIIRGVNTSFIYVSNGAQVTVRTKTWGFEEEGTEGYDQVGGEDRGRPFKVTDGFNLGFEAYQEDELLALDFLAWIANADANLSPIVKSVGLVYKKQDGTKAAFKASKLTPRLFKSNMGGRGDAVMFPSGFRARYFNSVQAAP